jgi:hypothetical protein
MQVEGGVCPAVSFEARHHHSSSHNRRVASRHIAVWQHQVRHRNSSAHTINVNPTENRLHCQQLNRIDIGSLANGPLQPQSTKSTLAALVKRHHVSQRCRPLAAEGRASGCGRQMLREVSLQLFEMVCRHGHVLYCPWLTQCLGLPSSSTPSPNQRKQTRRRAKRSRM